MIELDWIKIRLPETYIKLDIEPFQYATALDSDGQLLWVFKDGDGDIGFMAPPCDVGYDLSEITSK